MKIHQTLDEARKYLLYVSDALNSVAQAYSTDKEDRTVLEKIASDIFDYSNGLDQLKNNIVSKEQTKRKLEVTADLESAYENQKRISAKATSNLRIIKAVLEKAKKSGIEKDIEEAKKRVAYYTQQHALATQLEMNAKRDLERGA
jgi:predicted transcriptional regulator